MLPEKCIGHCGKSQQSTPKNYSADTSSTPHGHLQFIEIPFKIGFC